MTGKRRAIFLDRDGVLIEDRNLLVSVDEVMLFSDAMTALTDLKKLGFLLLVVTNQTVVCRGLATENDVRKVHEYINSCLQGLIDGFYFCPHHPQATLAEYRIDCDCRKPKSGMLFAGAAEFGLEMGECWMVGDRISDIIAGKNAGCRTIQILTGEHESAPIISDAMPAALPEPDFIAESLSAVCRIIEENMH